MDRSTTLKFLLFLIQVQYIATYFEVTMTDVRPIVPNDNKFINFDNLRIRRVNKTEHVISGSFEVFVELSNDYELAVLFYRKAGNDYKMSAFHSGPEKFCDYLMNKAFIFDEIHAVFNVPAKETCPWPKGIYSTTEPFRVPIEKIPSFLDGDYMAEVRFTQDDVVLNGYQVYFNVIRI